MNFDHLIINFDSVLRALFAEAKSNRPYPDNLVVNNDAQLTTKEKQNIIALMRVNHCGEICAQALYQGQALTAKNNQYTLLLEKAKEEEIEHLAWCKKRIIELNGKTSILNPVFYFMSLKIGVIVGLCGDKWSLGFLEETEKQVGEHLQSHINLLPAIDMKSKAILTQMITDEAKHGKLAYDCGAEQLPLIVKILMKNFAKVMTKITYTY